MRDTFLLLRTLSACPEVAKELMKMKTIEEILAKILPVCKNEKDIKMMRHYLAHFAGFIAGYSTTEEGQKILLKVKELYEFSLFVLDSVNISELSLVSLVQNNMMFLRNTAFNRSNKLHFISNP
jgi:hypothetical protein